MLCIIFSSVHSPCLQFSKSSHLKKMLTPTIFCRWKWKTIKILYCMFSLTCNVDNDTHYLLIKFFDLIAIYSRLYTKKGFVIWKVQDISNDYFIRLYVTQMCFCKIFFEDFKLKKKAKKKKSILILRKKPFFGDVCQIWLQTQGDLWLRDSSGVNQPRSFLGHSGSGVSWRNVIWWTKSWGELSRHHVTCAHQIWPCQPFFFFFFFFKDSPYIHLMEAVSECSLSVHQFDQVVHKCHVSLNAVLNIVFIILLLILLCKICFV